MSAPLLGALPRPPLPSDGLRHALVHDAVRAQEAAGLDPITDGGSPAGTNVDRDNTHGVGDSWRATQDLTERAVKQAIAGPYSTAHNGAVAADRRQATLDRAMPLTATLRGLAAAGCPLIEVHEPAAVAIGADEGERILFREAQLRLLDGVHDSHLSLAITGGNAYAAATGGRGPARVGLASASSLAHLSWEVAVGKLQRLGDAARLAEESPDTRILSLDPRAVSSRSAALGHVEPRPSRRPDRADEQT